MEYTRLSGIDLKSKIGERAYISFLARDVSVRMQKDNVTKYIVLNMTDKGKCVEARIFGASEKAIEEIKDGNVYNAAIDVKAYDKSQTGYSCIIYNFDKSDLTPTYFVDWADRLQESQQIIQEAIIETNDTIYGSIAYKILIDNWDRFSTWPAGKSNHHTRLGDLLVHTAEVTTISDKIAEVANDIYGDNFVNRQLLLASALIHDIGKIDEMDANPLSGSVEYSTSSALSTHILNCLDEINEQAFKMGIGIQEYADDNNTMPVKSDEQLEEEKEGIRLLKHCVAAHHGKLEYGSPIEPSIPEAFILNKADEISAELYKYNKTFDSMESGHSLATWAAGCMKTFYKQNNN